ncbi:hypothetical protein KUTeg_012132 [Tegillarca granosa]|uniref:G-protein coupled receptors family 1 profile domain-containing protein n=1 Tax=Tegillarca granosa TaxID=220873 RepID=A0ABQ9EYN0_TEGGR|nr:hypothetical protein KUTeg_012132 [Tegillarca granosa]
MPEAIRIVVTTRMGINKIKEYHHDLYWFLNESEILYVISTKFKYCHYSPQLFSILYNFIYVINYTPHTENWHQLHMKNQFKILKNYSFNLFYIIMSGFNNVDTGNFSSQNFSNQTGESFSEEESMQSMRWGILALLILIFCSALGNLLVCLAVCSDRRLQNMTNYFLMSLAIADFLVSILVMPLGMVVEIYGKLNFQKIKKIIITI